VKKTKKLRGPPMKYSAMVFAFGEPVLRGLGADAPRSARHNAIQLVIAAWNALVADEVFGTNSHLAELRRSVASLPGPGASLFGEAVDALVARKRALFPDQRWLIGKWELVGEGDDLRLRVEAHAPPDPSQH
jgi:hypothetical protein